jgi:hypothetical protein
MRKILLLILFVLLSSSACSSLNPVTIRETGSTKYAPGQVWTYRTRPGEESSRLLVLRTDEISSSTGSIRVVHVRIEGLKLRAGKDGTSTVVPFMSFTDKALERSTVKLEGIYASMPDFQAGYDRWKASYLSGKGSVLDVSVANALNSLEMALNPATPTPQ